MKLLFEVQFSKDLDKASDKGVLKKVARVIENLEKEKSLTKITNLKKMKGADDAYRVRIGDYRLCFFYSNGTAILTRFYIEKTLTNTFHNPHTQKFFLLPCILYGFFIPTPLY